MEYVLYGIGYIVCGYATFRAWAYLRPPTNKKTFHWCSCCGINRATECFGKEDEKWVIDDNPILAVVAACFVFWPVVLIFGGCIFTAINAIPKTKPKNLLEDSRDLLEEDFSDLEGKNHTRIERKKYAHTT